ncbi:MAG TPA: tRNA 2-thiouridine(34) synthase MnmA [Candidatus Paceibacterota bacterium]|nr:tRNA 2-thiouridine(34) synthase MnmA [Candidatus Paceibacterota bacterium]
MNKKRKTVFVGMSGGVDSSVSAALLKKQGFDVIGVFIKTWHPNFIKCNEEEERRDAMRVAAFLDIPFLTFDLEEVYKKQVADYMISEYKAGRTPNPDVMCNKEVKFGAFMKKSLEMGADYVATGHYAQNIKNNLVKAKDPSKDQVYFLWTLNKKLLSKIIFPVGNLNKTEVRKLASKFKIPVAEKKDSQGICFLGAVDLKDFLKHYIKEKRGKVLNEKGEEIGFHDGAVFHTLGERHGFTITKKKTDSKPFYIIKKDIKKNILYVSNSPENLSQKNNLYKLESLNWINSMPKVNKKYTAQIRYHGEFLNCRIKKLNKNKAEINFEKEILVAAGQSCVFYDKNVCLGGGVIV